MFRLITKYVDICPLLSGYLTRLRERYRRQQNGTVEVREYSGRVFVDGYIPGRLWIRGREDFYEMEAVLRTGRDLYGRLSASNGFLAY